jgi:hypothetical protein
MKKISVTIIDHDNHEITDNRRTRLKSIIKRIGCCVNDYPFVWGDQDINNPICESNNFVKPGILNFVHTSNRCANDFIDFTFNNFPDSWVVEYSGGGISAMENILPRNVKHIIYPKPISPEVNFPNLNKFIEAIIEGVENPQYILLGFDPILETKLELLHCCSTPEGSTKILNELPKINYKDDYIENIIKKLASLTDCFSIEYINILTTLRDQLDLENPNVPKL